MEKRGLFICLLLFFVTSDSHACFNSNKTELIKVKTGSTFYRECKCEHPYKNGVLLEWVDPYNRRITKVGPGIDQNVYSEWFDLITNSLYISNAVKSISGSYKCVTLHDDLPFAMTYNVEVYDPPYFVNTEDVQYAINGKDSLIACEARGDSDLSIRWHKGGEEFVEINEDDEKYKITPEGLVIKSVKETDRGVYKCIAFEIETVEAIDKDITVQVISFPTIEDLVATPDNQIAVNSSLTIECLVSGMPHPEYTWRKVSEEIIEEANITYRQEGNTIIFDAISYEDRGSYECTATNKAGKSAKAVFIEVLLPPEITEFNNITAIEGSIAQILCQATGHPIPQLSLDFLGEESDDQSIVWDTKNASLTEIEFYLTFLTVNRTHGGAYVCNASNEVSSVSATVYLTVLYAPYFNVSFERVWVWKNQNINLSCEHHGNPPGVVTWNYRLTDRKLSTDEEVEINKIMANSFHNDPLIINNKTLRGIFECVVKNELGQANKTILVQEGFAPPTINHVSILNQTSNSVIFFIDGPYEVIGPEVIGYTSEYDESENYNITDIHMNRTWSIDRPFRLDRLKANTSYYIKFAAINNVGEGAWSETFHFFTLEKNNLTSGPDEPEWDENVQELVQTAKILKWKPIDKENIDFYAVRYCPIHNGLMEDDKCKEDNIEDDKFYLDKMESNTTYYFQLVAHNALGESTAAHVTFTTAADAEPLLSSGEIIIISIIVVFICLVLLDLLLLVWKKQGVIARCCNKKNNKRAASVSSRDKKGLLNQNTDTSARSNGHRQYEYNKTTGVITGKHSAV